MDGRSKSIHIYKGMPFEEFTQRVLEKFDISIYVMRMHYSLKFIDRRGYSIDQLVTKSLDIINP